ncbi:MAG TPA: SusC/RagA family TonB-linked outer membrane protein, partial [Niastella sp.]
ELVIDKAVLIKGRVFDIQGLPVQMASVVLERTHAGTQTDRSGAFTLKVKKLLATDSLNISFVGLRHHRMGLNGKTDLGLIVMQLADNVLDEAMITAYGTTSEKFRTGDITTVKAADIERTPALNVVEALAGRVPGLYVRQNGSNPGSIYNIQLRGVNVIPPTASFILSDAVAALSKPLIVLDGLPMPPDAVNDSYLVNGIVQVGIDAMTGITGAGGGQDPLYWLNPLDIESITVLKDAEATALYGSRAANGVIIITSKKGRPGKTALTITFNTGVNTQARRLKLLNTQQYLDMRHEAWNNTIQAGLPVRNVFGFPSYTPNAANSYDLLVWDTTRYTDWQKVLLGSTPVYNTGISLSGGEGRTAYRLTAGYNSFKASYPHAQGKPGFREEKGTLSLTVSTHSLSNRLKITTSVMASIIASWQPIVPPENYIFLAPNAPALFDASGNINFVDWRPAGPTPNRSQGHPLSTLAALYWCNRFNLLTRTTLSYELFRSLIFTIGAGYLRGDGKQRETIPAASIDPIERNYGRYAFFGNSNSTGLNVEPDLRYEIRHGRHHLGLLAGASYQSDKQEGQKINAEGYISDELMGSPAAATYTSYNSNIAQRKSISAFGRISYRYADEFLIDLSARRDGSSSFGPGRRYGNFGSVGWGWIFTREAWSKKIPLITFGKIRGSYGITGSQNATPYAWLSSFSPSLTTYTNLPIYSIYSGYGSDGTYQSTPTFRVARTSNSTLGWAQAVSIELGIDLYLLADQRLKLAAQWYRKITGNQLVNHPVSTVSGTTTYLVNLPAKVENSGVEAMVDYAPPQRRSRIHWYAHFNIAANRNKLQSYPGLENSPYKDYYEPGQPILWQQSYASFLDKSTGVYKISDSIHLPPVPNKVSNYPVFTGGLQLGISYKGFSLSLSCVFAKQKGFTNAQGALYPGYLGPYYGLSNQPRSVVNDRHWQSAADATI